jgi:citrate lyase beta subunit
VLFTLYLQKIKENGPLVRKQGVNRLDGKMFQELMIERVKNVISIE